MEVDEVQEGIDLAQHEWVACEEASHSMNGWLVKRRRLVNSAASCMNYIVKQLTVGVLSKLGDKTGDKRKTKPGRRTQHHRQGGHTTNSIENPYILSGSSKLLMHA